MKLNQLGLNCWTFTRTLQQTNIAMENPRKKLEIFHCYIGLPECKKQIKNKSNTFAPNPRKDLNIRFGFDLLNETSKKLTSPPRSVLVPWNDVIYSVMQGSLHYQPARTMHHYCKGKSLKNYQKYHIFVCSVWFPHLTNLTNMSNHVNTSCWWERLVSSTSSSSSSIGNGRIRSGGSLHQAGM